MIINIDKSLHLEPLKILKFSQPTEVKFLDSTIQGIYKNLKDATINLNCADAQLNILMSLLSAIEKNQVSYIKEYYNKENTSFKELINILDIDDLIFEEDKDKSTNYMVDKILGKIDTYNLFKITLEIQKNLFNKLMNYRGIILNHRKEINLIEVKGMLNRFQLKESLIDIHEKELKLKGELMNSDILLKRCFNF